MNSIIDIAINAVIFGIIGYISEFSAINIVDIEKHHLPLFDIGFDNLAEISATLVNYALIAIICCFLYLIIFNKTLISHFIKTLNVLFAIRFLCFIATQVPPSKPNCFGRNHGEPIIWVPEYKTFSCLDYMFSGHATFMTLIAIITHKYLYSPTFRMIITIITPIILISIIAARLHYTVDVIVAIFMTYLTESYIANYYFIF